MTTSKILKAAIIGLRHGHTGKFVPEMTGYISTFKHLDGVEVVAYCEDSDTSLLEPAKKAHPSAHLYTSVDDLIAKEDFDLAIVVLPSNEIPPTGIKLAEAGKHFYIEKQYARRADDLAELARVVRRTGVKVMPGYPHRFNPVCQDLKKIIDSGVLGRPLDIEARMITSQVRPGLRDPKHFMYTDREEGGGILHMLGGHYLEVMRFLMGCEVKSVQAMTGRPMGLIEEPLEDVAICAFEYQNGAFGSMHAGYLQSSGGGYDTSLVYRGTEGEANWTPIGSPSLTVKSTSSEWAGSPQKTFEYEFVPAPPGYAGDTWMFNWLQNFIYDVQSGREPALTIDDALNVLQSIDASYESARTGRRVDIKYGG